ncbi:hypothetical protein E2F98_26445 [Bacillus cereus]|nr:hypothetical protein DT250_03675 [Bacillus sp. AR2-1]MDR4174211.1 hypothetical protein [Bacillus nitratireducens]TEX00511.1 hypothetical protein E2F98_26445 [Bacillus cereus]MDR4174479.1 hypothetical protein [Bacillus nitratireducens]TKH21260.1 hypothetical protein FC690_28745 [Bacillus cereus]
MFFCHLKIIWSQT